MRFLFYGYEVRSTQAEDSAILARWNKRADAYFWMPDLRRENFLVMHKGEPIGFFQVQHIHHDQVRLHMQASPQCRPKVILRGLAKLVPLIEKALAGRAVKTIFFTSHSASMARFMRNRFGYERKGEAPPDGTVMAKKL